MRGQAIDVKSLRWLYGREKQRGRTQMRRIVKDALYTEGEYGGLLSEVHAGAGSGGAKSAVVSTTTAPLSTTVT